MADTTAKLGIEVDSSQAVKATTDLENLQHQAGKTERATDGLSGKSRGLAQSFKLQQGAAQQAGYQIQDFAVQVSNGTSVMTAFGQQGSQLAGIFGPGGAVIGAVIAVSSAIGGVLLSSLMSTSKATKELEDDFKELGETIEGLTEIQKDWVVLQRADDLEQAKSNVADYTAEVERLENLLSQGRNITTALLGNTWEKDLVEAKAKLELAEKQVESFSDDLRVLNGLGRESGEITKEQARLRSEAWTKHSQIMEEQAQGEERLQALRVSAFIKHQQIMQGNIDEEMSKEEQLLKWRADAWRKHSQIMSGVKAQQDAEDLKSEQLKQNNIATIHRSMATVFSAAMKSQSKELFEIGKIGSIGQAIMSAYEAINKTLAQGGMFAIPAASAIGAAAFANVASIASQKFGSTSSGGGSTPAIPTNSTPEETQSANVSNVNINLQGEVFGRETVSRLISEINEAVADGATVSLV